MKDPAILGLATTEGPFAASQGDVRAETLSMFDGADFDVEGLSAVFENAAIARRTFAWPLERFAERPGVAERAARFAELAPTMLADAARGAADGSLRKRITHVVTVCSSGIATPTLECVIASELGIPASARRVPVFGLGCAGGAAGLAIARDLALSAPDACVLLLVIELTSLTLITDDASRRNFVACALFGDGAAAAVIGSPTDEHPALATIGKCVTKLIPETLDLMGWGVEANGWRVVFSPRIPAVVKREVGGLVAEAMDGARPSHFVLHPGGAKVLDAYRQSLELGDSDLVDSAGVLRDHGNMSAATVLFVLDRVLRRGGRAAGPAVLTAFGPGFSAEAIHLSLSAS